jgi:hypothetical protein
MLAWLAAVALSLIASSATAALAPADQRDLAASLRNVSEHSEGAALGKADSILTSDEYDSADFAEFFATFFARHPLTEPLSDYLALPTLRASSELTRQALQEALAAVLVDGIASSLTSYLPDALGPTLESDPMIFEHLRSSMQLLGRIAFGAEHLSKASRTAHYARLKAVIDSHPEVLKKHVTIDTRGQPKVAAIRAHLYKNLRDLAVPFDSAAFVADAGFAGRYADLVRDHGVIVLDNNGFDERQLEAIDAVLSLIPSGLHRTGHISQHALLGNQVGRRAEVRLRGSPGVNVFAAPVDGKAVNQFPMDSEPVVVPRFCATLQHELNHMVNEYSIRNNPAVSLRMHRLIEQAGSTDRMQYLRSTLPEGFFADQPKEFFASIANQYLSNSVETLLLALRRFEQGWREPINQFLFFAEVYSGGSNKTLFVEQDSHCNYSTYTVPLGRDAKGRINRITWQGVALHFRLDETGNVIR